MALFINPEKSTTQQKSTESTAKFTAQQIKVLMALGAGASVTEATKVAKVDRSTYYLWRKNPDFEAELNRSKKEQADTRRQLLQELADTAISTIKEMLTGTDVPAGIRLKAAIAVLHSLGTLKNEPIGHIDPEKIKLEEHKDMIAASKGG